MTDTMIFQLDSDFHRTIDIGIYNCGKRIRTQNHIYGPEIQKHTLFVFVNQGEATLHYRNGTEKLKAHDLLIMLPGEKIQYVAHTPWSIQWVGLYGQTLDRILKSMGVDGEHPVLHIEEYHGVEEVLESLCLIGNERTEYAQCRRVELLFRLFSLLLHKSSEPSHFDIAEGARRMIDYNFERELTVDSLARSLHITPEYLTRKFTQKYGIAPKAYLIEKRIEYAKLLLEQGNATVSEVASSVGYADSLYFSRIFKKREGCSPSAYQKNAKAKE